MEPKLPILLLFSLIILFASSCIKDPVAAFSFDPAENPESGEIIEFTSESIDASHVYWDFGNGNTSEEESASTVYLTPGDYTVTLIAESLFHSDSCVETIIINPPTILELYAYNPDGEPLDLARVKAFFNSNDAMAIQNMQANGTTNSNGYLKFENLDAVQYYLFLEKPEYAGAYLSGGYVGPLVQNVINTFYTVAQFYPNNSSESILSDTSKLSKF